MWEITNSWRPVSPVVTTAANCPWSAAAKPRQRTRSSGAYPGPEKVPATDFHYEIRSGNGRDIQVAGCTVIMQRWQIGIGDSSEIHLDSPLLTLFVTSLTQTPVVRQFLVETGHRHNLVDRVPRWNYNKRQ